MQLGFFRRQKHEKVLILLHEFYNSLCFLVFFHNFFIYMKYTYDEMNGNLERKKMTENKSKNILVTADPGKPDCSKGGVKKNEKMMIEERNSGKYISWENE